MRTNLAGRKLIMDYEGCSLKVYLCPAGVPTIGYGHTGPETKMGMKPITQHQAEETLEFDLQKYETAVAQLCPSDLNANQFSALVSLVFNIGIAAFKKSTLLQRVNDRQFASAAEEFKRWVHGGGKVLPGLVKRRAAERALFLEVPS